MGYYRGGDCMYGRGDYYRGDYYRGDGLFSTLGRAIGGAARGFVTGGPLGAIGGAATAVLGAAKKGQGAATTTPGFAPGEPSPGTGISIGRGGVAIDIFRPGFQPPTSPLGPYSMPGQPGIGLAPMGMGGALGPCLITRDGRVMRGKPNKSTYVTRGGGTSRWPQTLIVHPRGTECVRSRRINVSNPRALRRAIRRMAGFAKLARKSIRFVSAKPPKGRPVAKKRR